MDRLDLQDMVKHDVRRTAACFQIGDSGLQKVPRSFAVNRRQDDEAGMNIHLPNQLAEVARILGDDDAVLRDA